MPGIRVSTHRYSFQLVRDAAPTYPVGTSVACPRDAVAIAQHVIGAEITECVIAVFVDARQRVTGYAEIARGTLNATRFTPRDVLVPAMYAQAASFLLSHNHPSSDVSPSRADRVVTAAMRAAARLIGIPMLDHVVVTEHDFFSFRSSEGWDDDDLA